MNGFHPYLRQPLTNHMKRTFELFTLLALVTLVMTVILFSATGQQHSKGNFPTNRDLAVSAPVVIRKG
jgi:hypothetical protein